MKRNFLLLASLPALAQTAADPLPAPALPPNLIFKLGGQADNLQGKAFLGKVTWKANEAWTLFASGSRSTLASSTQAPSPNGNLTTTSTTSVGGDRLFGSFDLGLQFDHSAMSDLLASKRYYLQPAFELGSWRVGFEGSIRTTDFDRLRFNNLAINTVSGPVRVSGYADLAIRDTGLGASLDYYGEVWRSYASYSHYRYGSFEGTTDVTRIWNASGQVSPEMFKALSGRLVGRLEQMSASRLNRMAALLDSTATAGIEANLDHTRWGFEANRDVDHLTNLTSDTYTGSADWKITPKFTLALQVGATRSEVFGTNHFAGLSFVFRTRPS